MVASLPLRSVVRDVVRRCAIAGAVALLFAAPGRVAAQECAEDCGAILDAALHTFVGRFNFELPFDHLVVDITEPGRVSQGLGAPAGRPLPITAAHVVASSHDLGFHAVSSEAFQTCFMPPDHLPRPPVCDPATISVGVIPFAPAVDGDRGSIHLTYYIDNPENSRMVTGGGLVYTVERDGAGWRVTDEAVVAQGHRLRCSQFDLPPVTCRAIEPVPDR